MTFGKFLGWSSNNILLELGKNRGARISRLFPRKCLVQYEAAVVGL